MGMCTCTAGAVMSVAPGYRKKTHKMRKPRASIISLIPEELKLCFSIVDFKLPTSLAKESRDLSLVTGTTYLVSPPNKE